MYSTCGKDDSSHPDTKFVCQRHLSSVTETVVSTRNTSMSACVNNSFIKITRIAITGYYVVVILYYQDVFFWEMFFQIRSFSYGKNVASNYQKGLPGLVNAAVE